MKQNNSRINYEYNDVLHFVRSSLFRVLHQEKIPRLDLLDPQSCEPIDIEDLISKITDQVESGHHYAQVYIDKDYDDGTYDIGLTKWKSLEEYLNEALEEYLNEEGYEYEDPCDIPMRSFIYEDITYHIRYQIDFVLSN